MRPAEIQIDEYRSYEDVLIFEGEVKYLEFDTNNYSQYGRYCPSYFYIKPVRYWIETNYHPRFVKIRNFQESTCGFPFQLDNKYLIYARNMDKTGKVPIYEASLCDRTKLIRDAKEDLDILGKPWSTVITEETHIPIKISNAVLVSRIYIVIILCIGLMVVLSIISRSISL